MQEFVTAAKATTDENEEGKLEFRLVRELMPGPDGEERKPEVRDLVAYKPEDGQLAVLMATTSSLASGTERVAGTLNFLVSVLGEEDHSYIVARLLDRHDPFGVKEVTELLSWMVEEWTGRPTVEPSGSTRSQRNTGRTSTRKQAALTT